MKEEQLQFRILGSGAKLYAACGRCQRNELLETYEAE